MIPEQEIRVLILDCLSRTTGGSWNTVISVVEEKVSSEGRGSFDKAIADRILWDLLSMTRIKGLRLSRSPLGIAAKLTQLPLQTRQLELSLDFLRALVCQSSRFVS